MQKCYLIIVEAADQSWRLELVCFAPNDGYGVEAWFIVFPLGKISLKQHGPR